MATIATELSMSLDGFIADPNDEVGPLFDWYGNGDVEVEFPNGQMIVKVSEASARHLRDGFSNVGALITGRRLFDYTQGWGGSHPMGVPVVVLSHSVPDGWPRDDAPFTFVTDGLESAVAQAKELAGDRMVGVAGPNVIQQVLNAGLLRRVRHQPRPRAPGRGHPVLREPEGDAGHAGGPHQGDRGRSRDPPVLQGPEDLTLCFRTAS